MTHEWYELRRDGELILYGSMQDCWKYIHDNSCYSVEHALKYEGYSMTHAGGKSDE